MMFFVLPHEKYDEAQKSLEAIRYGSRSIRTETELQTERLMQFAQAPRTLQNGHRYGIFEVHENCTAIRNGKQIPHSTEVYITVWTWYEELKEFACETAWGGTATKCPRNGMLLIEL